MHTFRTEQRRSCTASSDLLYALLCILLIILATIAVLSAIGTQNGGSSSPVLPTMSRSQAVAQCSSRSTGAAIFRSRPVATEVGGSQAAVAFISNGAWAMCYPFATGAGFTASVPVSSLTKNLQIVSVFHSPPIQSWVVVHHSASTERLVVTAAAATVQVWEIGHGFSIIELRSLRIPSARSSADPNASSLRVPVDEGAIVGIDQKGAVSGSVPIELCIGPGMTDGSQC